MNGTRATSLGGTALLATAFLLPAGDPPWFSFWHEWTAALGVVGLVAAALSQLRAQARPLVIAARSLPTLAVLLAVVTALQWGTGLLPWRGDAVLVGACLLGFGACMVVAGSLAHEDRDALADRLAAAMLVAGVVSAPLAIAQWAGVLRLDLDVRVVGGRPVAHMEQANLLCSLLIQAVFGAWRLHARGRLSRGLAIAAVGLLLVAISLTQSRVAWLVLVGTVAAWTWRAWSRRRAAPASDDATPVRAGYGRALAVIAVALVVGAVVVPWLDARLGFAGLDLGERFSGGRRLDVWALFVDAVAQRPIAGWGALQDAAAQFELANRHPPLFHTFSSAHDLVLDLMVWFGVPLGALAAGALFVGVITRIARAHGDAAFATSLAALALALHALVELPLQYAYFLFPFGLMLGLGSPTAGPARAWRPRVRGALGPIPIVVGPLLLLLVLARDYIPLSDARPTANPDPRTGHLVLDSPLAVPDAWLLDQLRDFQAASAVPPTAGRSPAEIASLRAPLRRYPFAANQEHAARVFALNGRPEEAIEVLRRECSYLVPKDCENYHRAWNDWRDLGDTLPPWPTDGSVGPAVTLSPRPAARSRSQPAAASAPR